MNTKHNSCRVEKYNDIQERVGGKKKKEKKKAKCVPTTTTLLSSPDSDSSLAGDEIDSSVGGMWE